MSYYRWLVSTSSGKAPCSGHIQTPLQAAYWQSSNDLSVAVPCPLLHPQRNVNTPRDDSCNTHVGLSVIHGSKLTHWGKPKLYCLLWSIHLVTNTHGPSVLYVVSVIVSLSVLWVIGLYLYLTLTLSIHFVVLCNYSIFLVKRKKNIPFGVQLFETTVLFSLLVFVFWYHQYRYNLIAKGSH